MQKLNWNNLRYLLAVKRGGNLSQAARLMGVDKTTVSRRLSAINGDCRTELFIRQRDNKLQLSELGASIANYVECMEQNVDQISNLIDAGDIECAGEVRITSVPIVINRLLVPNLNPFLKIHGKLQIELIPDARNFSLNFREADIAIRLARPVGGGIDTIARRIGTLKYSLYASKRLSNDECARLPWIGYQEELGHIPTAKWLSDTATISGNFAQIRVQDSETALEAAKAGLGRTLLPDIVAGQISSLKRLSNPEPIISREIWLLIHTSQITAKRIKEVSLWIETLVGRQNAN